MGIHRNMHKGGNGDKVHAMGASNYFFHIYIF